MKKYTYLLLLLFVTINLSAQVGINTDNSDPDASAMLDVKSTNKGVLIPRMSSTQRQQIIEPAVGLMVYDSTAQAFYYFNGMGWLELLSGSVTVLEDTDGDTKIQVEESADEDVIRFDIAGSEVMKIDGTGIELISSSKSTIIGEGAGDSPLSNDYNAFYGYEAGKNNATSHENTILGAFAGKNINSSSQSTLIGAYAGQNMISAFSNVYIGTLAGSGNQHGNQNTFIGMDAGSGNSGSGNVFLGTTAGRGTGNVSNRLIIDNDYFDGPFLYGEFDNKLLRINGTLNINNAFSFPTADGTVGQVLTTDGSGTTTWASLSSVTNTFIRNGTINAIVGSNIVDYDTDDFIFGSAQTDDAGNADHDSRFFFDKSKGAFRAGIEEGDKWDDGNRGIGSVALGNGNTAAGENSVAMGYQSGAMSIGAVSLGYQNGALGDVTVAIGNRNVVDTDTAFAIGSYNFADKDYALAVGTENEAQEEASTAIGYANLATAVGASAFGEFNEANGESSLALGSGAIANGTTSVAIGSSNAEGTGSLAVGIGNTAAGDFSQTFGSNITAASAYETVFGYFNTTYSPTSTSNPSLTDRLFVIGNGMGPMANQRSDALIILKNGSARINGPLTLGFSGNNLTSYTLPNLKGSTGQILRLNSSGMMEWTDAVSATFLADADDDTKVQVAESADEDIIRFDLGGTEYFRMEEGRLNVSSTGRSVFFGNEAGLNDDLSDNDNVFIGETAGKANTTGERNTAFGKAALGSNTTSGFNTAIGYHALMKTNGGSANIAVGGEALLNNDDAGGNVAVGHQTLYSNTTGEDNVALGFRAGYSNKSGLGNVLVGNQAGQNVKGNENIAIGSEAGKGMFNNTINGNISIGPRAGMNTGGNNNIFIGYEAGRNEVLGSEKLYIENSSASTPLIYGEFDNDLVRINGDLEVTGSFPGSDDQKIDVLNLNGNTLQVSLENDGETTKTVDLSNLAVPVGSIMIWATATPPTGWMLCNGQDITGTPLATVLGSNNAPNLQNRFPFGAGSLFSLEETGGRQAITLTEANIPEHNHDSGTLKTTYNYKSNNSSAGSSSNKDGSDVQFYDGNAITGNTGNWGGFNGSTKSFEILPPFLALNFIIKAE